MWQSPNQRLRAIAAAKKRERERKRFPMHIRRVVAELRVLGSGLGKPTVVTQARVMLNDISPKGVGLFCSTPLQPGQEVAITLDEPRRIYLRGRIIWCQNQESESHIISEKTFAFRMGIQFTPQSATEEEDIVKYCQELAEAYLYTDRPQV